MSVDTGGIGGAIALHDKMARLAELVPEAAQQGSVDGGLILQGEMQLHCPVHLGFMRSTITVDEVDGGTDTGPHTDYALFVEKGTGLYAEDGDGRQEPWTYWNNEMQQFITTSGSSPQPFVRPAREAKKDEVVLAMATRIRDRLQELKA